jgi:hypothetical protein
MDLKLTYFKTNGKYYTQGFIKTVETEFYAALDEVRKEIDGLAPGLSGPWVGPVLVEHDGFPHLLNVGE